MNKFYLISILSIIFCLVGFASAQTTPEFIVSWKALNYSPADYQGKNLPTNSTPVEISFDLVDSGKIVNLSKHEISWQINSRTVKDGVGIKSIKFDSDTTDKIIHITVNDYKGQEVDKFITIPSFRPEIIINTNGIGASTELGNYLFNALPLFFNVNNQSELKYIWKVNERKAEGAAENADALSLNLKSADLPQQTTVNISVFAQNLFNDLEMATKRISFVIE